MFSHTHTHFVFHRIHATNNRHPFMSNMRDIGNKYITVLYSQPNKNKNNPKRTNI